MEEKLYFAPANYGKGAKHAKKTKEKKNHKILKLVSFLLLIAAITIVLIWLLHGNTTTSGQYPASIKNEALNCETDALSYPKITSATSSKKNLKINAIFTNENKLKTIALIYTLYFNNEEETRRAEAFSHAEFNLGLNDQGYSSSTFENKFARYSDRLIISLFGNSSTLDEYTVSYFMLDGIPADIEEYAEKYQAQGFICNRQKE